MDWIPSVRNHEETSSPAAAALFTNIAFCSRVSRMRTNSSLRSAFGFRRVMLSNVPTSEAQCNRLTCRPIVSTLGAVVEASNATGVSAEKLRAFGDALDSMRRVVDFAGPLSQATSAIQAVKCALDSMGSLGVLRNQ